MKLAVATLVLLLIPLQDAKTSKDPDVRRIALVVQDHPLGAVLADLQKETGIPIEVDKAAGDKIQSEKNLVTFAVNDASYSGTLKLLLQPRGFKVTTVDQKKVLITLP